LSVLFAGTANAFPSGFNWEISIKDFAFYPKSQTTTNPQDTVTWFNNGAENHNVTNSNKDLHYFASPDLTPGGSFVQSFFNAGTFRYVCTLHPKRMKGNIKVPVQVSPRGGSTTDTFFITFTSGVPAGFDIDVQIKRPHHKHFKTFIASQTTPDSAMFVPDGGPGIYAFRARLQNTATGGTSIYSPVLPISTLTAVAP
jgi:plastocyanin